MLKSLCRSVPILLALSLAPFAHDAFARTPDSGAPAARPSFKSGFSSQNSPQRPAPSYRPSSGNGGPSGGFGSFSNRRAAPPPGMPAPDRASSRDGGFGSFSGARPDGAQRSTSASSRELTRRQAEENALRSLEERRARAARRDEPAARPDPDYRTPATPRGPAPSYPPSYPTYPPQDARQGGGGGLGNVIAGAVIANAINRHANAANYPNGGGRQAAPAPVPVQDAAGPKNDWGLGPKDGQAAADAGSAADGAARAGAEPQQIPQTPQTPRRQPQQGASFAGAFLWLGLPALLALAVWFAVRRARRKREADKPNYSFERN